MHQYGIVSATCRAASLMVRCVRLMPEAERRVLAKEDTEGGTAAAAAAAAAALVRGLNNGFQWH